MSLNEEILEVKEEKNKKKWSKKKIYNVILGLFLSVVAILFSLTIYSALSYESGYFYDLTMSPTINKTISNEDNSILYDYNDTNFKNEDGNVVEYGRINHKISVSELKRFDVVALTPRSNIYAFSAIRVIGLPGEHIKLDYYGKLYVNGNLVNQPIPEEYLKLNWNGMEDEPIEDLFFECQLDEGEFYLLKDNRFYARSDSRVLGAYTKAEIYGKVISIDGTCTISGGKCINRSFPLPRSI